MRFKLLVILLAFGFSTFSQNITTIDTLWIINALEKDICNLSNDTLSFLLNNLANVNQDQFSSTEKTKYSNLFVHISDLLLERDSPDAALFFVDKALKMDSLNFPAKLLQSKIYVHTGNLSQAYKNLKQVYSNSFENNFYQAIVIAKELIDSYIQKIKYEKSRGEIHDAFEYAKLVDTLLMLYPSANENFKPLFDSILIDIYKDYLDKLNYYASNREYDSLYELLADIEIFCDHYSYIFSINQKQTHVDSLQKLIVKTIYTALEDRQIKSALNLFNRFTSLCAQLKDFNCQEIIKPLQSNVYNSVYQDQLKDLIYAWHIRDLSLAKFYLKKMEDFIKDYNIKDTIELAKYLDSIYNYEISFYIQRLSDNLEAQQFDSALYILSQLKNKKQLKEYIPDSLNNFYGYIVKQFIISELEDSSGDIEKLLKIEKYILDNNFENDSLIWHLYLSKLKKISTHCAYLREIFFYNLQQYQLSMVNKNFVAAAEFLKKNLALQDSICPLSKDTIELLLDNMKNPLLYNFLEKEIFDAFYDKDYEKTFDFLLAADKFYYDKKLYKYGIEKQDLFQQITSFNTQFALYAAKRLVVLDSLDIVYNLLLFLYQQGVPSVATKSIQLELGERLAIRDFTLNPYEGVMVEIKKYKNHIWWFRYMLKSYIKQRSRMRSFKF